MTDVFVTVIVMITGVTIKEGEHDRDSNRDIERVDECVTV